MKRTLLCLFLLSCGKRAPTTGTEAPNEPVALRKFLSDRGYSTWAKESSAHESAGPHGGAVRTWASPLLADALNAKTTPRPVGAAAVKELFASDGTTVTGWAVAVKVADGTAADSWYWYEDIGGDGPDLEGRGLSACVNCHGSGTDYYRGERAVK